MYDCAKRPYVRERKIRLTKIVFVSFFFVLRSSESNCFLGRGYGGVFTARRRWRFDTSIFRISKVDRPYKWLRNSICRSRDPFLDHLFAHFLNLWKPPNWRWWRQIKIKVQFDDSLEPILSASTTNLFSVFSPFLTNQLRFALLPCTVYLVILL